MEIVIFSFGHLRNLLLFAFVDVHFLNRYNTASSMCKTFLVIKSCLLYTSKGIVVIISS